jgi:hypothetical protein
MNRQNLINRLVARKLQPAGKQKALCICGGLAKPVGAQKALCFCRAGANVKSLSVGAGIEK